MIKKRRSERAHTIVSRTPHAGAFPDEALFQNMINGAIRLSITVNGKNEPSDLVVLDVNSPWERFTGMKRIDVLGRRMSKLFPGMEPMLLSITGQMVKDGKGRYFEYYSRLFDRWFQTSIFSTAPHECMMLFSDITEIKRFQKKLEESEEKFRSIIEQSGDGIVLIDGKGEIIEYNATMEKISGIGRADAIGKKMWELQYRMLTHEKRSGFGFEAYKQDFMQALSTGSAGWIDRVFEVKAERDDGATIVIQILVSLIRVGPKNTFVSFCRDVTSLRKAEKELADQNKLLVEKNIALREVMSQLDVEKKSMADKVRTNIDRLVLPLLARIKRKCAKDVGKHILLLEENLRDITGGFGSALSRPMAKLTQQELEVCDMIRQGLRCREISEILNITVRTVETHRNHIRKKLSITGSSNNLATYLKNLD
jgi:PAS domain S-box-containing protein